MQNWTWTLFFLNVQTCHKTWFIVAAEYACIKVSFLFEEFHLSLRFGWQPGKINSIEEFYYSCLHYLFDRFLCSLMICHQKRSANFYLFLRRFNLKQKKWHNSPAYISVTWLDFKMLQSIYKNFKNSKKIQAAVFIYKYCNDPMFSDGQVWENIVDPWSKLYTDPWSTLYTYPWSTL